MEHYKSWAGLNLWLRERLCEELKDRISYFLTRYHKVHDSYGRGAILLDGKELVCFSWIEMYRKEQAVDEVWREDPSQSDLDLYDTMKPQWDADCTYCDMDFLNAILEFRKLSIQEALRSENFIIKILGILDKRVGKRTLQKIVQAEEYMQYPAWVRQFYELRIACGMGLNCHKSAPGSQRGSRQCGAPTLCERNRRKEHGL